MWEQSNRQRYREAGKAGLEAFEPQLVKKHQTTLSGDIEEKILSMYAKGMTTADIEAHIREIYGLSVPDTAVSRVTDKILLWCGNGGSVPWRACMR